MLYSHFFLTTAPYAAATALAGILLLVSSALLAAGLLSRRRVRGKAWKIKRIALCAFLLAATIRAGISWGSSAKELSKAEYIICSDSLKLAAKDFAAETKRKRVCVNGEIVFYNGDYKEIWSVKRKRFLDPDEIERLSNGRIFDDARTKYKWSDDPLTNEGG